MEAVQVELSKNVLSATTSRSVSHGPAFFVSDLKVRVVDILPGSTLILVAPKIPDMI